MSVVEPTANPASSAEDEGAPAAVPLGEIGAVVIGRNEGARLRRCLTSLRRDLERVVYVDSGSTDGSQAFAEERGVVVEDLDTSAPFTAARARNAGFARLLERFPEVRWVQFIDGDCELIGGWLDVARREALKGPRCAVVCGRRKERFPEATVYNLACDVEWDTPVGEAEACGGDALIRADALEEIGGFDPGLIAGEEPEMCLRLRRAGWRIFRVDAEMTWHDAQITRLRQWWKRAERSGHAYAEIAWRDREAEEPYWGRQAKRIPLYGLGVPAAALGLALPTAGMSLGLLGAYPYSALRAFQDARRRGRGREDAAVWAASCAAQKIPEALGWWRFHRHRRQGRRSGLIEYKS